MFTGKKTLQNYPEIPAVWKGKEDELLDFASLFPFNPHFYLSSENGLWKCKNFLPSTLADTKIFLGEGNTPEMELTWNKKFQVRVKLEHLNPTGSYKDRGAAVLMSYLKNLGIKEVVQDSSGNAGVSIAAYSRANQIKCTVFVPENTSTAKMAQIKAYGAYLKTIPGTRADCAHAALQAAEKTFYASHCYHPVFFQGTKTMLLEMALNSNFKLPHYLILPAGNGTLITGCSIALKELEAAGFDTSSTQIIAVQTNSCNPLFQKFNGSNEQFSPEPNPGLAEGIAIPNPVRGEEMLQRVAETNGFWVSVSEYEILEAWKKLAALGHLVESTSAAVFAAITQLEEKLPENSRIWTLFSGHGLKSSDKLNYLCAQDS
ncbi:MAG: pyridoxal-phosphate dependent enzyme [Bacteroidia bacterium]|nr:pyridoxal-phosphate dependent enzyme [Bacteroidia bacterium]